MTKQHFIALADALHGTKPLDSWSANKHIQWNQDVEAVAHVCWTANPRFKKALWLDYINGLCGPNGGKVK